MDNKDVLAELSAAVVIAVLEVQVVTACSVETRTTGCANY
jgi:hypothetical protein